MLNNDYKFDVELEFGKKFESKFQEIFTNKTKLEIKTERQESPFQDNKWMTTGNIVIEVESWGKKSGLMTTEANWWVHILSYKEEIKAMFMMEVPKLKQRINYLVSKLGLSLQTGGEEGKSSFYLIPIKELFKYDEQIKEARKEILKKTEANT